MVRFDHLVMTAPDLDTGRRYVEDILQLPLLTGGQHLAMGTHNAVLALEHGGYIEVIAVDPSLNSPSHPRWFDLDSPPDTPTLRTWVAAIDDWSHFLGRGYPFPEEAMALSRGELRWEFGLRPNAALGFAGTFPSLIHWQSPGPADTLPKTAGLNLESLELIHPDADALGQSLEQLEIQGVKLILTSGPRPELKAHLLTPSGPVTL
ncbi:VOC family protein [Pokkaliibacter sp. CJK22405]|uniref:VOC family protein n=1 Tax=Pokkaliibacter sp. CJK22405 TaxID=3384615 RepID=UPI0039848FD6